MDTTDRYLTVYMSVAVLADRLLEDDEAMAAFLNKLGDRMSAYSPDKRTDHLVRQDELTQYGREAAQALEKATRREEDQSSGSTKPKGKRDIFSFVASALRNQYDDPTVEVQADTGALNFLRIRVTGDRGQPTYYRLQFVEEK